MNNISNTRIIRTFKQVKENNFTGDTAKNIKSKAKVEIVARLKNHLYKADNERPYQDFKEVLMFVQRNMNKGGGNTYCAPLRVDNPFNTEEILYNLEILCTHRNQCLHYFNSNRKLNFGFGEYKDVNYTDAAKDLLQEIEIIKNDLPIKAFSEGINSIIFNLLPVFEAEDVNNAYVFKYTEIDTRKNDLAQEYKKKYLKDNFLNKKMSIEEIYQAFGNSNNFKDNNLLFSAVSEGNNELIQFFIEGKLNLNQYYELRKRGSGNYVTLAWNTTLYIAIKYKQIETIKLLVKSGADVNQFIIKERSANIFRHDYTSDSIIKKTPLRIAYEKNDLELISTLKQLGGKCIMERTRWVDDGESADTNGRFDQSEVEEVIEGWK